MRGRTDRGTYFREGRDPEEGKPTWDVSQHLEIGRVFQVPDVCYGCAQDHHNHLSRRQQIMNELHEFTFRKGGYRGRWVAHLVIAVGAF